MSGDLPTKLRDKANWFLFTAQHKTTRWGDASILGAAADVTRAAAEQIEQQAAELTRLRAELAQKVPEEWKLISDDAKTGDEILLWDGRYRSLGYYSRDINDPERSAGGWVRDYCTEVMHEPTHWMPIAAAPAPSEEEKR